MEDPIDVRLLTDEYYRLCEIFYAEYDKYNVHENDMEAGDVTWYSKGGELPGGGYFPLDPTAHLSAANVKRGRLYKKLPADNRYDYEYRVRGERVIKINEGNVETFSVYLPGEVYRVSYKKQWIDGERLVIPYYISRAEMSGGKITGVSFGIVDGIDRGDIPVMQFEYKKFIYSGDVISETVSYSNLRLCSFDREAFGRLLGVIRGEEKCVCPEAGSASGYVKVTPASIMRMHRNDKGRFEIAGG